MAKRATNSTKTPKPFIPQCIVSGGQTGVDRGALEAAIALGIEHGGWCPLGRLAEDGCIPSRYQLTELESRDYAARTEKNVIDSDGTLLIYRRKLTGGTLLTFRMVNKWSRPHYLIRIDERWSLTKARDWLARVRPATLNVAGPRESTSPGIEQRAMEVLVEILSMGK
jgi:hypothetical protein